VALDPNEEPDMPTMADMASALVQVVQQALAEEGYTFDPAGRGYERAPPKSAPGQSGTDGSTRPGPRPHGHGRAVSGLGE